MAFYLSFGRVRIGGHTERAEFLVEHFLLAIEHVIELPVEGGAMVHVVDVGEFVEHDEALEVWGQEDAVEREVDGVLLATEQAVLARHAAAPSGAGAVDLDLVDGESVLPGQGEEHGRQIAFGQGSHALYGPMVLRQLLGGGLRVLALLLLKGGVALDHGPQPGPHLLYGSLQVGQGEGARGGDEDALAAIVRWTERISHRPGILFDIEVTEFFVGKDIVNLHF